MLGKPAVDTLKWPGVVPFWRRENGCLGPVAASGRVSLLSIGHAIIAAGIALLFQPAPGGLAAALALGVLVGWSNFRTSPRCA
jgi:hypothetical protein